MNSKIIVIEVLAKNTVAMFSKERCVTENGHEQPLQAAYLAPFLEALGSHGQRHPSQALQFPTSLLPMQPGL